MKHITTSTILLLLSITVLQAQQLRRYPVVGNTTDTSATIAVWLKGADQFRIEYGSDSGLTAPQRTALLTASQTTDFATQVDLGGLSAATRYYYRAVNSANMPIGPIQSFKTFPKSGADANVTILFGSCQQKTLTDQGLVFNTAKGFNGDVFLQTGDWTYADALVAGYPESDTGVRASYEFRLDTNYPFAKQMLSQMSLCYAWDDNDYTDNDSDGSRDTTTKQRLLNAYKRYLPHYPLANPSNGIWHSFRIGNAEVFVIDSRSQRRPNTEAFVSGKFNPPAGHSMLAGYPISGVNQRTWLLNAIRTSKARWKIVVSPVFFNPEGKKIIDIALLLGRQTEAQEASDKWCGFPEDIDSMKTLFNGGFGKNMIILSGDAHVNVYDDGTHSLVPEFMVGNLDNLANPDPFALLQLAGSNIWTKRLDTNRRTVGRLRIQTTPVHKLIVESFDESGKLALSYEMTDKSTGVNDRNSVDGEQKFSARIASNMLYLQSPNAAAKTANLKLYSITGACILDSRILFSSDGEASVDLPQSIPNGTYLGMADVEGNMLRFRVTLMR